MGIIPSKKAPPLAVQLASAKFWNALEARLRDRAGTGISDGPISGSLAPRTVRRGPESEQEHGTQEEAESLGGVQGASCDRCTEGRQDASGQSFPPVPFRM